MQAVPHIPRVAIVNKFFASSCFKPCAKIPKSNTKSNILPAAPGVRIPSTSYQSSSIISSRFSLNRRIRAILL